MIQQTKSAVKPENFISIQGWMITELGLKNSELLIYALIYGFSQDARSAFTGSLSYLQEWTQASKQTVITALQSLAKRGLIARIETNIGGTKSIGYYAKPRQELSESLAEPDPEPDGGPKIGLNSPKIGPNRSKNLTDPVKKLDPINIDINIDTSNILHTPSSGDDGERSDEKKKEKLGTADYKAEFEDVWKQYPRKQGKKEAEIAYIAARREGTSREQIAAGIEAYKQHIDESQIPMRYVMQGGNWFEGRRWEDDKNPPGREKERPNIRALNYPQTNYTADELKKLGIDLGEDLYED